MESLDEDIVALMSRRAYDVAASSKGVSVFLNGNKLAVRNFKDYIDLHVKSTDEDSGPPIKIVHEVANERWEVACCPSDRGFQQVSFVNSIATYKGGRHVDHVVDNLIKQLLEVLKKKNKGGFCFELPRAHTDLCNLFQVASTSSPSRCGIISGFSSIV